MAHRKLDSVQQLATGTGTGALTLGAATAANYRTMQAAGMTNGDTMFARIQHETILAEWEEVMVTYNAGAITRTFDANAKSATGAGINFSTGNKIVTCVLRAGDAVVMDNNGDVAITRDAAIGRNAIVAWSLFVTGGTQITGPLTALAGIQIGTVSSAATTTPLTLDMGGTYSSAAGANAKLKVYNDGVSWYGFGVSSGQLDYMTSAAGSVHAFYTGGIKRGTIGSAGLSVGTVAAPTKMVHVYDAGNTYGDLFGSLLVEDLGSVGAGVTLKTPNSSGRSYSLISTGSGAAVGAGNLSFFDSVAGAHRWLVGSAGHLVPAASNTYNLGSVSLPIKDGWIVNAWTVTSTREAKALERNRTDAERRAAARIKARGPRFYKMAEAVAAKGDKARWHVGYIAEDVRDDMIAEKLDPWAYGFLCADPLMTIETTVVKVEREKVIEVDTVESGIEVIDGKPTLVTKPGKRQERVGEIKDVVDDEGRPVEIVVGTVLTGEPIIEVARHFVPEMEMVDQDDTREVPVLDGKGKPVMRLGLRYSELEAFLRCAD